MYRTRHAECKRIKAEFSSFVRRDRRRKEYTGFAFHQLPSRGRFVQRRRRPCGFHGSRGLHLLVSRLALRKSQYKYAKKPLSQPQTARLRHQKEQAQFCGTARRVCNTEDAPQSLALCRSVIQPLSSIEGSLLSAMKSIQNTARPSGAKLSSNPSSPGIEQFHDCSTNQVGILGAERV